MPHKQHYVPNFILRNFASNDGVLWVLDKETGRCWPNTGGKEKRFNDFAENNYFPSEVDRAISQYEHHAAPILKRILERAREGTTPSLSREERLLLCKFLQNQILRSPRVKVYSEKISSLFYHSMLIDDPEGDPDDEYPEREWFQWMLELNLESGVVSPQAHEHLVVSDEPCWFSEDFVVMRIAKDSIIQLANIDRTESYVHRIESDFVNKLNLESMKKAQRFVAGPDPHLLHRLYTLISGNRAPCTS